MSTLKQRLHKSRWAETSEAERRHGVGTKTSAWTSDGDQMHGHTGAAGAPTSGQTNGQGLVWFDTHLEEHVSTVLYFQKMKIQLSFSIKQRITSYVLYMKSATWEGRLCLGVACLPEAPQGPQAWQSLSPAICAHTSSLGQPSPSGPGPHCTAAPGTWLRGPRSGGLTHPKAAAA